MNPKEVVNDILLKYRRTLRLLESDMFQEVWSKLSEQEQLLWNQIILDGDVNKLKQLLLTNNSLQYTDMSARQLRTIAKERRIYNWSRKTRYELIAILEASDVDCFNKSDVE